MRLGFVFFAAGFEAVFFTVFGFALDELCEVFFEAGFAALVFRAVLLFVLEAFTSAFFAAVFFTVFFFTGFFSDNSALTYPYPAL